MALLRWNDYLPGVGGGDPVDEPMSVQSSELAESAERQPMDDKFIVHWIIGLIVLLIVIRVAGEMME